MRLKVLGYTLTILGAWGIPETLLCWQGPGVLRVDSNLVLVNATVLDDRNRFISDLQASDFQLRVDGKATPVVAFWQEDQPVSAVIVLDVSGSMKGALRSGKVLLSSLFRHSLGGDEYALILCKEPVEVAIPFTQDVEQVSRFAAPLMASGATPLYDAIDRAIRLTVKASHERRSIVVITDGEDTSSRLTLLELKNHLVEADVHLYVLQLWEPPGLDARLALEWAADRIGGLFFKDVSHKHFNGLAGELDIHRQYVIAFRPNRDSISQKPHRIQLRASAGNRKGTRIYHRGEYSDPG